MRIRPAAPAVLALCLLSVVACGDDENDRVRVGPDPILTGSVKIPPSLEGSWLVTTTPAVAGCGAFNTLLAGEAVLTIAQVGEALTFTLADACGRALPGGDGRVDLDRIVALTATSEQPLSPACGLVLEQVLDGLVEDPPNVFSGSNVLTIAGSDLPGLDACDPSLPCTVSGSFTATRCDRSGCSPTCAP